MRRGAILLAIGTFACGSGGSTPIDARTGVIDAPAGPDADWGPPPECDGAFPALQLTRVVPESFALPTAVAAAPGDPTRLYVVEQGGV